MISAPAYLVETARLGLRPWSLDDAPAHLVIAGDPRVWAHLPAARGRAMDLEAARERIARMIATHAEHGLGHWALIEKATGELVGSCGFRPPFRVEELELGFKVAPARWGRGYASEIVAACARYGLTRAGRIVSLTSPDNAAARRVLEKAGLAYEGETVEDDARWVVYAITRG